MRTVALYELLPFAVSIAGSEERGFRGVAVDSRECEEGALFAALPGQDPKKHAGEIWAADESGIHVRTGAGILVIEELQMEGKKRMAVQDFLRGHKIEAGSRFE